MDPAEVDESLPNPTDRVPRSFFARPCEIVSKELLGCTLVRIFEGQILRGKIVEVEAYLGAVDAACHAFQGKKTEQNKSMYLPPGYCYVYQRFKKLHCFNISTNEKGNPCALLIRAIEPFENVEVMRKNRMEDRKNKIKDELLCAGPAKLCKCLSISLKEDGIDLIDNEEVFIEWGTPIFMKNSKNSTGNQIKENKETKESEEIEIDRRVRIDYAGNEAANTQLRFSIKNNRFVSVPVCSRPRVVHLKEKEKIESKKNSNSQTEDNESESENENEEKDEKKSI